MASSASAQDRRLVLRIGFEGSLASAQGIGAREMASAAAQLSNGTIELELFPDAKLGSGPAMIEMVRQGELDVFFGGVGYFSALESRFNVFDIPYLFETVEQAYKVMDGKFGREMLSALAPHGLKGLGFWENGIRSITNNTKPICRPEDVQGLKIRVMPGVPAQERLWRRLGAETTPLPSGAIYKAIQDGRIDSQEHPVSVLYARRFYEVQNYLSLTRHLYGPLLAVMNLSSFESATAAQQEIVLAAAGAGARATRTFSNDNEALFLAEMKASGLQVNAVDAQPFKDRMRPASERDFIAQNGKDWLQKIEAALAERD